MEKKRLVWVKIISLSLLLFSLSNFGFADTIDEKKPEVKFARQVEIAINEGKEAYFALYSSSPVSTKRILEEEKVFGFLKSGLQGEIVEVKPMDKEDAQKFKNICPNPFYIKYRAKSIAESFFEGELTKIEGNLETKFPIGKIKGKWKILYIE